MVKNMKRKMKKSDLSILGLGIDIIEISRIIESIELHGLHFLNRLFSQNEQEYCNRYKNSHVHFAGRFAAKEALVKALGTGFGKEIGWGDIEILNDENGKPLISLSDKAKAHFDDPILHLSISHCKEHATAVVIWEARKKMEA